MSAPGRAGVAGERSRQTAAIRRARAQELGAVLAAVSQLLVELGSTPPPAPEMLAAARALHDDPSSGVLLVAVAEDEGVLDGAGPGGEDEGVFDGARAGGEDEVGDIVGVLAASFQVALHVPGRYAVIQDLWVAPAWRSRSVGHQLVAALCALAAEEGMSRAEVGLPRESFRNIQATESFYLRNRFSRLGPRMRRAFQ